MAAFPPDLKDCVDNRLPFWSGEMLAQLKTLLNTPGRGGGFYSAKWLVAVRSFATAA